jgi:hypothetical protein
MVTIALPIIENMYPNLTIIKKNNHKYNFKIIYLRNHNESFFVPVSVLQKIAK